MGGKGSGRPGGWGRDTVESHRALDVNRLHAAGCFAPGWSGSLRWTRDDDEEAASIALRAEADRIVPPCCMDPKIRRRVNPKNSGPYWPL